MKDETRQKMGTTDRGSVPTGLCLLSSFILHPSSLSSGGTMSANVRLSRLALTLLLLLPAAAGARAWPAAPPAPAPPVIRLMGHLGRRGRPALPALRAIRDGPDSRLGLAAAQAIHQIESSKEK